MREDKAPQSSDTSLFKRLFSYSLPHKARFLMAFMMLTVAISAEMAIPWLAKTIIDDVIVPQQFEWQHLIVLISLVMMFYVISALFTYLQAVSFRHVAQSKFCE